MGLGLGMTHEHEELNLARASDINDPACEMYAGRSDAPRMSPVGFWSDEDFEQLHAKLRKEWMPKVGRRL